MYRRRNGALEFLLAHPGGPLWTKRDESSWSIPKGEAKDGEGELFATALREFEEETGIKPKGEFISLGSVTQKSGKVVHAWAFEGDCDTGSVKSNTFKMEWPPRSGRFQEFPEIDRAEFFTIEEARKKINPAQVSLLEKLKEIIP